MTTLQRNTPNQARVSQCVGAGYHCWVWTGEAYCSAFCGNIAAAGIGNYRHAECKIRKEDRP